MDEISNYDRSRALEMQARGALLDEIALTLDVSVAQLDPILRELNRSRIPKSIEEREAEAGKHLAMLERIVDEMSRAWEKSKSDAVIVKETVYNGQRDNGEEVVIRRKVETTRMPNIGNTVYIKEMRSTLEDIRRMIALDAPQQIAVEVSDDPTPRRISIIEVVKPTVDDESV
jgi:hypothetical protein